MMKDFLAKAVAKVAGKSLEEAKALLAEHEQLKADLAEAKAAAEVAAGEMPGQIAALTEERDGLLSQVSTLSEEKAALEGQVTALTAERDGLVAAAKSVEATFTAELARFGMDAAALPGTDHEEQAEAADPKAAKAEEFLAAYQAADGDTGKQAKIYGEAKAAGINLRTFALTGKLD